MGGTDRAGAGQGGGLADRAVRAARKWARHPHRQILREATQMLRACVVGAQNDRWGELTEQVGPRPLPRTEPLALRTRPSSSPVRALSGLRKRIEQRL